MAASCFLRPFSGCTLSCKSSLPMVATRGRTFKRPWRRSCLSSKLKSSSAPIGRKDSWCFHAVGSSNAPLLGSTAAEGLPRIGRTSIATRWRSCGLPQSASCSENFVIPPDVFGQTLIGSGEIDGVRVPFAKEPDQPRAARGSDIIRDLQQAMNCLVFERWMFPELQKMRAADAPVPELYQLFEHRSRHPLGNPRQLGFACIDVDRRPCENKPVYLAGISRAIDK